MEGLVNADSYAFPAKKHYIKENTHNNEVIHKWIAVLYFQNIYHSSYRQLYYQILRNETNNNDVCIFSKPELGLYFIRLGFNHKNMLVKSFFQTSLKHDLRFSMNNF